MNAQKRRARALQAAVEANLAEEINALADCLFTLSPELWRSFARRVWQFTVEERLISADAPFPLDLLPDRQAAREALARLDDAIGKCSKHHTAESRRGDLRWIAMIRAWLNDNPEAQRLLEPFRRV